MTGSVFVHEQSVACKFLRTIFLFIARVTLYDVIDVSRQLNAGGCGHAKPAAS